MLFPCQIEVVPYRNDDNTYIIFEDSFVETNEIAIIKSKNDDYYEITLKGSSSKFNIKGKHVDDYYNSINDTIIITRKEYFDLKYDSESLKNLYKHEIGDLNAYDNAMREVYG